MWMPLDIYLASWDGTGNGILDYSQCPDEELPEEYRVLKLIRAIRQGKLDFMALLHRYSRGDLDQLLQAWNR